MNQTIKKEVETLLHDFLGTERWEKVINRQENYNKNTERFLNDASFVPSNSVFSPIITKPVKQPDIIRL
jgi:hypothetical protein